MAWVVPWARLVPDFTAVAPESLAGGLDPGPGDPGLVGLQAAMVRQVRSSTGARYRRSGGRVGFIGCCLVPVVLPLE